MGVQRWVCNGRGAKMGLQRVGVQGHVCKDGRARMCVCKEGSAEGRCARAHVYDGLAKAGVQGQGSRDGSAEGRCARLGVQRWVCKDGHAKMGVQGVGVQG